MSGARAFTTQFLDVLRSKQRLCYYAGQICHTFTDGGGKGCGVVLLDRFYDLINIRSFPNLSDSVIGREKDAVLHGLAEPDAVDYRLIILYCDNRAVARTGEKILECKADRVPLSIAHICALADNKEGPSDNFINMSRDLARGLYKSASIFRVVWVPREANLLADHLSTLKGSLENLRLLRRRTWIKEWLTLKISRYLYFLEAYFLKTATPFRITTLYFSNLCSLPVTVVVKDAGINKFIKKPYPVEVAFKLNKEDEWEMPFQFANKVNSDNFRDAVNHVCELSNHDLLEARHYPQSLEGIVAVGAYTTFDYHNHVAREEIRISGLPLKADGGVFAEEMLKALFSEYGDVKAVRTNIVFHNRKSICSGVVTYSCKEEAFTAIKESDGMLLKQLFKKCDALEECTWMGAFDSNVLKMWRIHVQFSHEDD